MFHFIINPSSSSGRCKIIWESIKKRLITDQIEYAEYITDGLFSATKHAKEITAGNEKVKIVVIGGDGTLNEVLTGIRDYSLVTLGYIPGGSSNDFARDMGITSDPDKALESVLHPKEYAFVDVGQIEYGDTKRNFAVSAGIGYDAAVCHEALQSNLKKTLNRLGLGKLTYVGIALKQIIKLKLNSCRVILDDKKEIRLNNFIFVAAMIHHFEGGGLKLCPEADYRDGILDICAAGNMGKLKLLFVLPTAYKGKHLKYSGVDIYKARKVRIITDVPCAVHTDGESCGMQNDITIIQDVHQIRIITG